MSVKPIVYLAGGMENAPEFGSIWRKRWSRWLDKEGWDVHNPCEKETEGVEEKKSEIFERYKIKPSQFHKLKKKETLEIYKDIMADIRDFDLHSINHCDVVLVWWDEYVAGGTMHEIGHAFEMGIPIVAIAKVPLKKISGWYLSMMNVCHTEAEAKRYLKSWLVSERTKKRTFVHRPIRKTIIKSKRNRKTK